MRGEVRGIGGSAVVGVEVGACNVMQNGMEMDYYWSCGIWAKVKGIVNKDKKEVLSRIQ